MLVVGKEHATLKINPEFERVMIEINGINHLGLRVRDLGVKRAFYEKLGFEFLGGPIGPEPVAIVEHPSGVNINFILNASTDA
ncbi:MAG: lactoylglutathione lyase [Limisphaerales bacterium]|jgi:lactoylglutathione lyase